MNWAWLFLAVLECSLRSKGSSQNFRTSRTNERTFISGGGGLDLFRCAIDSKKRRKKSVTVSGPLCGAYRVKFLKSFQCGCLISKVKGAHTRKRSIGRYRLRF